VSKQNQSALRALVVVLLAALILLLVSGLAVSGHHSLAACLIVAPVFLVEILALAKLLPRAPEYNFPSPRDPFIPSLFQRPPPCMA